MQVETICVCGAGTMGRGIAQVAATADYSTILYELDSTALQQAKEMLHEDLKKLVTKGKLTLEKKEAVFKNLIFTSDLQQCKAALVIEAIVEKMGVKTDLFQQLAALNSPETIFASNTSSLSIT